MKSYDIYIDYTTGSSFGSERISSESIGIAVFDIGIAKENLMRIKDHYDKYINTREILPLILKSDGKERQISPFWIGYFETLHGAKIMVENDSEMEFRT